MDSFYVNLPGGILAARLVLGGNLTIMNVQAILNRSLWCRISEIFQIYFSNKIVALKKYPIHCYLRYCTYYTF